MQYPNISIFFPAYNEEKAIKQTVSKALQVIPTLFRDFEIIIVNDGSTDKTGKVADALAEKHKNIRVVHHSINKGYGAALRSGFAHASKDLVFFTDGDGQFDITELKLLRPLTHTADLVIGYRIKRRDPFHRLLFAKLYGLAIRILFGLKVKDVDCAFKLIKKSALKNIEELKSDGALISAELLIKAKKKGFKIEEVGVHHYPRKGGKPTGAKISVILKAFYELLKLRRELR